MEPSDPTRREEHVLREAVLSGDATAWRILYDRSFEPLYAYVLWRAGRRAQVAEDVVSECWLVAVRRIRRFDPDRGPFEAWLRGIADNLLRNALRRTRIREGKEEPLPGGLDSQPASPSPSHGSETAEEIALALTALPFRYQEAIRAKYEEGLAVKEMAERWGETPKAVESLLARARAAFREAFAKEQSHGSRGART